MSMAYSPFESLFNIDEFEGLYLIVLLALVKEAPNSDELPFSVTTNTLPVSTSLSLLFKSES